MAEPTDINVLDIVIRAMPIMLIGAVVGTIQFLDIEPHKSVSLYKKIKLFIKISSTAGILALLTFFLTDGLDLTYQTRMGISIFVSFTGYDKVQKIVDKVVDAAANKCSKS